MAGSKPKYRLPYGRGSVGRGSVIALPSRAPAAHSETTGSGALENIDSKNTGRVARQQAAIGTLALEKPQPEILLPSSVPIARIKTAPVGHLRRLPLGERNAQPSVVRLGSPVNVALQPEI